MVNQEGLGRGLLRIGVRTPDRAVTPTLPPEIEPAPGHKPGEHPKEKAPSSKKALIARLAGSLLALAGIAGPAVDHHINYESELNPPAVGRDIVSVPGFYWDLGKSTTEDIQRRLGFKETPVPSTFDNSAEKIKIGDNNIVKITPEEADAGDLLTPNIDLDKKTVVMPFPFILPPGTTATFDKTPFTVRGRELNTPRMDILAGTPVVIPEGMHYRLVKGNPEWGGGQDPDLIYDISAVMYDKKINKTISLGFYFYDREKRREIPFSSNLPAISGEELQTSINNWEGNDMEYWEKFPVSDGVSPIASSIENQQLSIYVEVFDGKGLNYQKEIKDIQLQWQQQDGKLLVLAPSN